MFYAALPIASMTRANLATFLNVSGRLASGIQQLTELNVQTVRTMIEESNSLLRAGDESSPGDVFGWQSIMLAQFPEKAASYGRHFLSIITSTEADIVSEARSQYERTGIGLKGALNAAAQDAQAAAGEQALIVGDMTDTMAQSAGESASVILDASGEVARKTADTGVQAAEIAEGATAKARASSKR
jgi:phasin family protein